MINEKKSGKKDACYRKVKARYKVWPSAYASGALVKCRKKGAKNWGNKSESIVNTYANMAFMISELSRETLRSYIEKAHKEDVEGKKNRERGLRKAAEKLERAEVDGEQGRSRGPRKAAGVNEAKKGTMPKKFSVKSGDKSAAGGLTAKGVKRYRAANPGSKLKTAVTTKPSKLKKGSKAASRRKSFCSRMKGMRKRQKPSNNTGKDRLSLSLKKWNC